MDNLKNWYKIWIKTMHFIHNIYNLELHGLQHFSYNDSI